MRPNSPTSRLPHIWEPNKQTECDDIARFGEAWGPDRTAREGVLEVATEPCDWGSKPLRSADPESRAGESRAWKVDLEQGGSTAGPWRGAPVP